MLRSRLRKPSRVQARPLPPKSLLPRSSTLACHAWMRARPESDPCARTSTCTRAQAQRPMLARSRACMYARACTPVHSRALWGSPTSAKESGRARTPARSYVTGTALWLAIEITGNGALKMRFDHLLSQNKELVQLVGGGIVGSAHTFAL
eukprot:6188437-Pleurochrysis_carterae.AAC.1